MELDIPTSCGAMFAGTSSTGRGRLGESDKGARSAEALGAAFPLHHLMVLSIAFRDRVLKGSWVLFASRRRA